VEISGRGASSHVKMEVGVIANNDRERKWGHEIEFKIISSITGIF
jgi:hypothetical protein